MILKDSTEVLYYQEVQLKESARSTQSSFQRRLPASRPVGPPPVNKLLIWRQISTVNLTLYNPYTYIYICIHIHIFIYVCIYVYILCIYIRTFSIEALWPRLCSPLCFPCQPRTAHPSSGWSALSCPWWHGHGCADGFIFFLLITFAFMTSSLFNSH